MPFESSRYLEDIRRFAVLEREEEHRLAVEYRRTGEPKLASRLAEGHLRLVLQIAHRYAFRRHDFLDLVAQGNLGLLIAVRRFDPHRGTRLSTYAVFWIRAMIMQYVMRNRRLVRVGTTARERSVVFRLRRERQRGEEGLAQRLGVSEKELALLVHHLEAPEVAWDDPAVQRTLATEAMGPDEAVARNRVRERVRRLTVDFAETLDPRDRLLFSARWLDEEPPSLAEMGRRLGVTRERARQLEARLLKRLGALLDEEPPSRRPPPAP